MGAQAHMGMVRSIGWAAQRLAGRRRFLTQMAAVLIAAGMVMTAGMAHARTIRIIAFGTSATAGRGISPAQAYPAKLQAALRAKGYDVVVVNQGKYGDTAAGGLARLNSAVPRGTDIAIVEFGINERRLGMDQSAAQSQLDAIVDRLRQRGVEVLVANGFDVSGGAQAHGALYVNFDPGTFPSSMHQPLDPLHHLTAEALDIVAARMLPSVEQLIARVQARGR